MARLHVPNTAPKAMVATGLFVEPDKEVAVVSLDRCRLPLAADRDGKVSVAIEDRSLCDNAAAWGSR
jgi:hypothetical protein